MRSLAISSVFLISITKPTFSPSFSAIQARSFFGSNSFRNFEPISAASASKLSSKPYSRA